VVALAKVLAKALAKPMPTPTPRQATSAVAKGVIAAWTGPVLVAAAKLPNAQPFALRYPLMRPPLYVGIPNGAPSKAAGYRPRRRPYNLPFP
jgi:hypothetical protein